MNASAKRALEQEVLLWVYDPWGGFGEQRFTITVYGGNGAPTLTPLSAQIQGAEGQPFDLFLDASDADDDALLFHVENLPPGAVFEPALGRLLWLPEDGAAGTYEDVTFVASDGVNEVRQSTTIVIAPTNQPPVLLVPPEMTFRESEPLSIQLSATGPPRSICELPVRSLAPDASDTPHCFPTYQRR